MHHRISQNGEIIAQAPLLIAVTFIKGRSGFERDGSFSTVKGASWQMFDAGAAHRHFVWLPMKRDLAALSWVSLMKRKQLHY